MKESLYFPVIDNGGGNSRSAWGLSMFMLGMSSVMHDRKVIVEGISYPYPDGAMCFATNGFIKSECDRMIIIDTDEVFNPVDFEMLLSHDVEFVSGLYPKKVPGLQFPVVFLDGDNPLLEDDRPPLREVKRVARGFLNLHRSVFEKLTPHVERYTCSDDGQVYPLYWKNLPGGHSEDFYLCDLWRSIGGKVYIDHRIRVRHEGSASYPIPGTY